MLYHSLVSRFDQHTMPVQIPMRWCNGSVFQQHQTSEKPCLTKMVHTVCIARWWSNAWCRLSERFAWRHHERAMVLSTSGIEEHAVSLGTGKGPHPALCTQNWLESRASCSRSEIKWDPYAFLGDGWISVFPEEQHWWCICCFLEVCYGYAEGWEGKAGVGHGNWYVSFSYKH